VIRTYEAETRITHRLQPKSNRSFRVALVEKNSLLSRFSTQTQTHGAIQKTWSSRQR